MLLKLPRQLPAFSTLLDDLGQPSPADLAAWLDVHPRTVLRWIKENHAPRASLLALFWLTRWGASELECAAINDAARLASMVDAMGAQVVALQRELARVVAAGDFGTANAPTVRPLAPLAPDAPAARPALRLVV